MAFHIKLWNFRLEEHIQSGIFPWEGGDIFSEMTRLKSGSTYDDIDEAFRRMSITPSERASVERKAIEYENPIEHYFLARKIISLGESSRQALEYSRAVNAEMLHRGKEKHSRAERKHAEHELERMQEIAEACGEFRRERYTDTGAPGDEAQKRDRILLIKRMFSYLSPEDLETYALRSLATIATIVQDDKTASESFDRMIQANPSSENLFLCADYLQAAGNDTRAAQLFRHATERYTAEDEERRKILMRLCRGENVRQAYIDRHFRRQPNAGNIVLMPNDGGIAENSILLKINNNCRSTTGTPELVREREALHTREVELTNKARAALAELDLFDAPLTTSLELKDDWGRCTLIALKREHGQLLDATFDNMTPDQLTILSSPQLSKGFLGYELGRRFEETEKTLEGIAMIHAKLAPPDNFTKTDLGRKLCRNIQFLTGDSDLVAAASQAHERVSHLYEQMPYGLNTDSHMFNIMVRKDGRRVMLDWGIEDYVPLILDVANVTALRATMPCELHKKLLKAYCEAYARFSGISLDEARTEQAYIHALALKAFSMTTSWISEGRQDMFGYVPHIFTNALSALGWKCETSGDEEQEAWKRYQQLMGAAICGAGVHLLGDSFSKGETKKETKYLTDRFSQDEVPAMSMNSVSHSTDGLLWHIECSIRRDNKFIDDAMQRISEKYFSKISPVAE